MRKPLIIIFLILNIVAAFALLLAFCSQFISPETSVLPTYCGLVFPYLVCANLFFVLFWIFVKLKCTFFSIIILLLNINNIDKYYQFSGMNKPDICDHCVKVMTYNVQLFGLYNSDDPKKQKQEHDKVLAFLKEERPDILCLQEFFYDKSGELEFNTVDSIFSALNILKRSPQEYKQYYATAFPAHRNDYFYGVAIFSRYKIISTGVVENADSLSTNASLYADIKYNKDTIRVYCIHLESFKMDKSDYKVGEMLAANDLNDPYFNRKALKISDKMLVAYKKRAKQSKLIRKSIKNCSYPLIVCGDFNDTPVSYSYAQIGQGLKDAFRSSGKGMERTYHGEAFPSYRIDYIFHSKCYKSYACRVCHNIAVSDHYPVCMDISLRKH